MLLPQHAFAPNEITEPARRLIRLDRKAQSSLQHVILWADIVAEVPIRLLNAATIEHVHAAQPQPHPVTARNDGIEHMPRHLHRHI